MNDVPFYRIIYYRASTGSVLQEVDCCIHERNGFKLFVYTNYFDET
jgi:hypothetical protein